MPVSNEFLRIFLSRRSLAILFALEIVLIAWFAFLGGAAQGSLQQWLHVDDKVMHMAAFACAGFTAFLLWSPISATPLLFVSAALVELIQHFIPGRASSLSDLVASLSGGAFGAVAALIVVGPLLAKLDIQVSGRYADL